jgi:hypothetical protein
MTGQNYISCPKRPGSPRVAEAICRACAKKKRCPAWQRFLRPTLFPNLHNKPRKS